MTLGPVQLLIIGFDPAGEFRGQVMAELERLRVMDVVRLIDALLVHRAADGSFTIIEAEDDGVLGDLPGGGMHVRALTGLDPGGADLDEVSPDSDVWYPSDAIPRGATVALAVIEHTWAIGLRDAIGEAGGSLLAEAWVHPEDLVTAGLR
ncbi:MAG TPA: DUF6325 family protein [Streptosporangiaceae bacterium]|jgi:hypothetical protein